MDESRIEIEERLAAVRFKLESAAKASGADPRNIALVAVTKTRTAEEVMTAASLGVTDFGENRVQEFLSKCDAVDRCVRWHVIGPMQTNKVKYLKDRNVLIQSLDRLKLAEEIERRLGTAEMLVQVNISREPQKNGIPPEELERFLENMLQFKAIRIRGIMCVAEDASASVVRKQFREMRGIFEKSKNFGFPNYEARHLSMGMSSDYEMAILEGSNMVRIGTEIFGRRL